jgi:MEMO1 family protein
MLQVLRKANRRRVVLITRFPVQSFPFRLGGFETRKVNAMKKFQLFSIFFLVFFLYGYLTACGDPASNEVRPPAVAGGFYPSNPGKLKLAIQKFLESSPNLEIATPIAILAPHAGYIYAGQIYADAYRQVMGRQYDVIVILGTNHTTGGFSGISLGDYTAFRTPLGDAQIDQEVVTALLKENKDCRRDREVHIKEHSIEVQVPFIQILFPQAKIVPAVIYPPDLDLCKRFGDALAKVLLNRRALIVISTDLSHYPSSSEAAKVDRSTLESIAKLDIGQVASLMKDLNVSNLDTRACGEASILAGLTAAKSLGAKSAIVAGYANSGDVSIGDQARAVGYGALVLAKDDRANNLKILDPGFNSPRSDTTLQDSEKKFLLALARDTIHRYLTTETVPLVRNLPARMTFHQGAFVTLKENGQLRGCIGHMAQDDALGRTVAAMAMQAAFNDPRFAPLQAAELNNIEIELSILTPMKSIKTPAEIVLGRDGVLIVKGSNSAVFLPQVAVENNWKRDEMLDNLCVKAGLAKNCWKRDTKFQVFQAEVFSESEFIKKKQEAGSRKPE